MLYVPGSSFPHSRHPVEGSVRLVRTRDLRPLERGSPIATMYVSDRGGGIRRLIGSAHRHVIALRRDPQMDHGQPTEGIAEGPAAIRCATDPDVGFYQMQPFRVELPVGNSLASWTADLLYVQRDGTVRVREVKRTTADLVKPEYVAKLEAVCWLLSRIGWTFSPWTLAEIEGGEERQVNAATIYFDRAATIDDLMPRFEKIAISTPATTFGDLVRALDSVNTNRARAAVHRLIMRGRVWTDMDRLIEDWSEVRLRPAAAACLRSPLR